MQMNMNDGVQFLNCAPYFFSRRSFGLRLIAACMLCAPLSAWAEVQIQISGVRGELERNVRAYIGEPVAETDSALQAFLRSSRQGSVRALQALGYYRANVRVQQEHKGSAKRILIHVDPGEPVRIGALSLRIEGPASAPKMQKLLRKRLQLESGDVFHHGRYEDAKRSIRSALNRNGFFEHQFNVHRVTIDREKNLARVELEIQSGPRYRFGPSAFTGSGLNPELLQGMLPYREGDPYDADQVARLNRVLQDSGYFSRIALDPQRSAPAEHSVRVQVQLQDRPDNVVSTGLGYATDTGPRLRLDWEKPRLNAAGHAWRNELDLSAVRERFSSSYRVPLDPPLSRSVDFGVNWLSEEIEDTDTERFGALIQIREPAGRDWERVVFLRHDMETFQTGLDSGRSVLIMPGVNWSRTRRQGGLLASWGDRQFFELKGGGKGLGSDIDILQLRLGTKWLRSLYAGSRLQARLDLGSTLTSDFADTPPSLRYFAGGDQSIRGFAYQSLGPRDGSGDVVGARNLAVGSMELDWKLRPDWRGAVFIDGGGAVDSFRDPLQIGTGVGLRWISPVGPVRLDFAVGREEDDHTFRVHLSLGPDL